MKTAILLAELDRPAEYLAVDLVTIAGFDFGIGDSIHTESSRKPAQGR